MTIKEASKITGISIDNLRYYERIGLIPEVPRNASGIRNYDDMTLSWLEFVMRFKRGRMALESIREYVQLVYGGGSCCDYAKAVSVSVNCKEDPWEKYYLKTEFYH